MTMEQKDALFKIRSYKMTPTEIESLLQTDFGDKIQPVNQAKLAKQNQQRAKNRIAK